MSEAELPPTRLKSGLKGLDAILLGGFLRGGVYIVQGLPGSGKTILANQICFNHVAAGEKAVYATLLAESHARLLLHLKTLSFFDASRIPESLFYMSGFTELEQHGLKGLLEVLRREVRARKASLLVLDGLVSVERSADDEQVFRRFIHDLQVHAHLVGCTVLLLNSSGLNGPRPEHTMVDGVIDLGDTLNDQRGERGLIVKKFRGSRVLRGVHAFTINDDGIQLHPRLESVYATPTASVTGGVTQKKVTSGIDNLDRIVGGGLRMGSTTVVVGPSGAGKTILGLHFLAAASEAEPALLFGFYENPEVVALKSRRLGLRFDTAQQRHFHMVWQPPTEDVLDALGNRLLDEVKKTGARRVLVDGLDGFFKSAVQQDRMSHFLSALTNELRALNATTIYTLEVPNLIGGDFKLPLVGISPIVENLIVLRFVEVRTRLFRLLSILKMRDSEHETSLYEFSITNGGVFLEPTSETAESILAGTGPHRMVSLRAEETK